MSVGIEKSSPLTGYAEFGSAEKWMGVPAGGWHEQNFRGDGECREGEGKGSPLVVWRGMKDEVLRLGWLWVSCWDVWIPSMR